MNTPHFLRSLLEAPSARELLGREPTRLEEELLIYLIRIGRRHRVHGFLRGEHAPDGADAMRAVHDVSNLLLEHWHRLDSTHQDSLREALRVLLWRIQGREPFRGTWQEARRARREDPSEA